jgi:hypothetical protein
MATAPEFGRAPRFDADAGPAAAAALLQRQALPPRLPAPDED